MLKFDDKDPDTTRLMAVDFADDMPDGATISSASVTVSVEHGTDASPDSMRSGSYSISGTQVRQMVTGGVHGVTYLFEFTATLSDGQVLQETVKLRVAEGA